MINRSKLEELLSLNSKRNTDLCELAAEAKPLGHDPSEHDVDGALDTLSAAALDPSQRLALGLLWAALTDLAKGDA